MIVVAPITIVLDKIADLAPATIPLRTLSELVTALTGQSLFGELSGKIVKLTTQVMRTLLIIITGVLLLNAALLYAGAFTDLAVQFVSEERLMEVRPEVLAVFKETLETAVSRELGSPMEGYEPNMFLQVFPGLAASDFDGVQASVGQYVLRDGQLTHELNRDQLVHSAAGAITRNGMETLYRNIAQRIGVDMDVGGTLTDVMAAITRE